MDLKIMPVSGVVAVVAMLLVAVPHDIHAEEVTIRATADATLIQDNLGSLANGSGPAVFVGRTGQRTGGIRRAVIRFDVSEALPEKAIIQSVNLNLHLSPSNEQEVTVTMHRLLQSWSEGPAVSSGGSGAPSNSGDSTWLHTRYDDDFWTIIGGHYVKRMSTAALVGPEGHYNWPSTPTLVADVRGWQRAPHRNFGWILIGDEAMRQSVKRFDSRESANFEFRPTLTIEYRLPGEPLP
jgi:hypothetical protein